MNRISRLSTWAAGSILSVPAIWLRKPCSAISGLASIPDRPAFSAAVTSSALFPMGETMPSPVIATRRMGRLPSSFVPVYGRGRGRSKRLEGGRGLPGAVSNVGCADEAAIHLEQAFQSWAPTKPHPNLPNGPKGSPYRIYSSFLICRRPFARSIEYAVRFTRAEKFQRNDDTVACRERRCPTLGCTPTHGDCRKQPGRRGVVERQIECARHVGAAGPYRVYR